MWHRTLKVLQVSARDFFLNNCNYIAAGIAYWALFSLFPLCLAGIAVLSYIHPTRLDQERMVQGIIQLVPVSADYLARTIEDVARARGTLGVLALVGLVWTGTAVFSAMRKGVNHAWGIKQPPYFLIERLQDVLMLVSVGVTALFAMFITAYLLGLPGVASAPVWLRGSLLGKLAVEMISLAVTVGVFLLLYRYLPHTKVAWRDIWPGAVVGAVMFQAARDGSAWFITSFSNFNLVYGSLSALMAVLLWVYLSALALIWGAQVSSTYSRLFGTYAGREPAAPMQPTPQKPRRPGFAGMLIRMASRLLPPKEPKG